MPCSADAPTLLVATPTTCSTHCPSGVVSRVRKYESDRQRFESREYLHQLPALTTRGNTALNSQKTALEGTRVERVE